MIYIKIFNSKCKVDCTLEEKQLLRSKLRIRVPGAFFSDAFRSRVWDGFKYYLSEAGYIETGLIPKLCDIIDAENWGYELIDNREKIKHKPVPTRIGKLELRDYQLESANAVVKNYYKKMYFPRGVLDEATNAGKNLIAAALFKAYSDDKKLIFVVNRKHIYEQAIKEIGELVGENEIGYIGPDGIKWNRLMICMAQSISSKIHSLKGQLQKFDICIVDEAHLASSPTYKEILYALENSYVRVGMSGTPFKHKDKNKNERILAFFGPTLHKTTNKELIDQGFSTEPIITVVWGNTQIKIPGNYKEEETQGLIKSKERNGRIIKRIRLHIKKGRVPILVICKFHNHTELVYKKIAKNFPELRVKFIHVKVRNRMEILEEFKNGEVDILVSSLLIKEGKNLPLIRALIFAAGGDSAITVLQVVGRALRKHKSKKRVYIDDFFDKGSYLLRHSKHRLKVYKDEGFKVINKCI